MDANIVATNCEVIPLNMLCTNVFNRDEMIMSLNNLKEAVDTHFSTISQSLAVLENDKELLSQMEILQSAVKSTSHPLHAVQAK